MDATSEHAVWVYPTELLSHSILREHFQLPQTSFVVLSPTEGPLPSSVTSSSTDAGVAALRARALNDEFGALGGLGGPVAVSTVCLSLAHAPKDADYAAWCERLENFRPLTVALLAALPCAALATLTWSAMRAAYADVSISGVMDRDELKALRDEMLAAETAMHDPAVSWHKRRKETGRFVGGAAHRKAPRASFVDHAVDALIMRVESEARNAASSGALPTLDALLAAIAAAPMTEAEALPQVLPPFVETFGTFFDQADHPFAIEVTTAPLRSPMHAKYAPELHHVFVTVPLENAPKSVPSFLSIPVIDTPGGLQLPTFTAFHPGAEQRPEELAWVHEPRDLDTFERRGTEWMFAMSYEHQRALMRWKPCCALCVHSMHSGIVPLLLCIALATLACYAAYAYVPGAFGSALLFGAARDDAVVSSVVFSSAGAAALVCAAAVIVGLACCCCARNGCCTSCSKSCSKHCGVCVRERHCSAHCGDMYKCRRLDVVASHIGGVGGFANREHVLALHAARELIAGLRLVADYGTLRDAGEEWREPASRCCTLKALYAGKHPGVHDTCYTLRGDRRFDRAVSCLEIALWPCLQCKPSVALWWEQRCIMRCKPRSARNAALRAQLVRASGAVADALLSEDDWLPLPNAISRRALHSVPTARPRCAAARHVPARHRAPRRDDGQSRGEVLALALR